jgi:hypothetical protein
MVRLRTLAIGLVAVCGLSASVRGHHSFAAYYLEDETMEIEGDIVEVQFRAPHTWVQVVANDTFGRPHTYAAEWANPSRLEREGISKDTLKAYDSVRVWGAPSRNPSDYKMHLKRIVRPRDGWQWSQARREAR